MNAGALNELARVVCEAQAAGRRTPMGVAMAVESAVVEPLRARIAELEQGPALPMPVGPEPQQPRPIAYAAKNTDLLLADATERSRAAEWPWDMWCRICHIRPTSHRTEAEALEAADRHVKLEHAPQAEVHKLMAAGGLAEIDRLRADVAQLKAERADEHDELAMALGRSNGTEWGDLIEFAAGAVSVEAKWERHRAELTALRNDALNVRGVLSPNGEARKVPFPLGETLTPAVEWLVARVAELGAEWHTTNEALDDAVQELRARRDDEPTTDTLPAWLHWRFGKHGQRWDSLDADDRSYWEHHAAAVRRAVARNGFKPGGNDAALALGAADVDRSADKLTGLLAPVQALREDEPDDVPCTKCGDPVHWVPSTNSDGGFWRHRPKPGRVLDHFGEVAGTEGRHEFEKEYLGESSAKRRLARCKHCGHDRTDPMHGGAGERP